MAEQRWSRLVLQDWAGGEQGVDHGCDTWLHWAEGAGALATWDSRVGDLDSSPSLFMGQMVSVPPRSAASLGK